LGEFSQFGGEFSLGSFLLRNEPKLLGYFLPAVIFLYLGMMVGQHFGRLFSQTHLVTLALAFSPSFAVVA
jgi:hypothetical protein